MLTTRAPLWLGVDVGTSHVKALFVDEQHEVQAHGSAETSWTTTATGAETTPDDLLSDVRRALAAVLRDHAQRHGHAAVVGGIGVAGMGESGILIEPGGRVSMPVIAWYDARGLAQVETHTPEVTDRFVAATGLFLDSQATVAKLSWWRSQGHAVAKGARWLNVPEWIAHRLGGAPVSEPSLASRTGLYDIDAGGPSDELAAMFAFPTDLLPEASAAGTAVGAVTDDLGLPELRGAVLTVAGHDHPVAAIGAGCTRADDLFNSCGTADVLVRAVQADQLPAAKRRALTDGGVEAGRHVLPGLLALNAGARNGLALQRILTLLGASDPEERERLDAAACGLAADPVGIEVDGFANRADEVLRIQLTEECGPADLWRASVHGAAQQTRHLLDVMEPVVGPHRRAVAAGGWSRFRSVRAAKQQVIDGVRFDDHAEPGALGAAVLAQLATLGPGTAIGQLLASSELSQRATPRREDSQ